VSVEPAKREALAAWLSAVAGARQAEITELAPLKGGAIQENWLLSATFSDGPFAGSQALVLRSDAPSGVAVSHSRAQEFALLQVAATAGVTVPEALWLCADPAVLGRPFYVMRRAAGVGLGPRVVKDVTLGGDRTALLERLGRELARIHSVKPPQAALDFLGEPPAKPAGRFVERFRGLLDDLEQPRPALEWGLSWCSRNLPGSADICLIHNDFRTGNYLVDGQGLTAVLDWEFADWGDPMTDIGWFCARCWRFGRPDLEAGGIGPRDPFYRGYESESGRTIDGGAVAFWEVAAHIRWGVIAAQQGERHTSGAERSLELALTGRLVSELELAVLQATAPNQGASHA